MTKTVLVAENDIQHSDLISRVLKSEGFAVKTVITGIECRQALSAAHPDLLIINADLPWGSGLGVLESLKEDRLEFHFHVILLIESKVESLIFPVTFSSFTLATKPVPTCELLEKVRMFFAD